MTTNRRRLTAFVLAGALLAGACSDGGGGGEEQAAENPEQAFTDALDAFAEYEGVTFETSIEADPADLAEQDTPQDAAEAIVNSSLIVSAKGSTLEDAQAEIRLNLDGNEDAVAFRVVGTSIYARAEVREMVEAFGGDMAMIDTAVDQASAMGLDFVQAAVDGEWVGVENLDDLAQQFGLPVPTAEPEQAAALQAKLAEILASNADVTSEGTDDVGAHLVLMIPLRDTVSDLMDALQSLAGAPAGTLPAGALEEIPATDVPVDVWVSDGRLVQIEIDVVAIAEAVGEDTADGPDEFVVRMEIDEFTDEIEAPDDFEAIDVQEIIQGLTGSAFGGTDVAPPADASGGRGPVVVPSLGLACSDLAGVPPEQIKTFLEASGEAAAYNKVKKACPELF